MACDAHSAGDVAGHAAMSVDCDGAYHAAHVDLFVLVLAAALVAALLRLQKLAVSALVADVLVPILALQFALPTQQVPELALSALVAQLLVPLGPQLHVALVQQLALWLQLFF